MVIKFIVKALGILAFAVLGLGNKGEKQVEAKEYWFMWGIAVVQFIVW